MGEAEEAARVHFKMVETLYEEMYRIFVFEGLLVPYILDGTIKTPCHLCIGQEAVAVGMCAALEPEDYVFGNHRSHGHYLAKGGDMKRLACEIFGKAAGCSHGHGGSMHICDPYVNFMGSASIVGGTIGLAVGAAMAAKLRRENRVAVAFLGDGATTEGVFYESLNLAKLYSLPVIFVVEDNGYSTHMRRDDIQAGDFSKIADAFNITHRSVNGNDVLAVKKAAELARLDSPSLLHCKTYRLAGHVGPNDNVAGQMTDIRPPEEVKAAWEKAPLWNYEDYITVYRAADIYQEVNAAIDYAITAPFPKKGAFKKNVFR